MSSPQAIQSAGRPLSAGAIALMLMLCLTWGFNQIAVKFVLPDIPPMLQAMIRSMGALPVLFIIGTLRGVKFLRTRRHLETGPDRRADVRHRIRADLPGPAPHLRLARGGVSLHRTVLRRARLLSGAGRAARRYAMAGAGRELCRRCARDRRAAGQCGFACPARRSLDRRWRFIVGGAPRWSPRAHDCASPRRRRRSAIRSRPRSRSLARPPGCSGNPSPTRRRRYRSA